MLFYCVGDEGCVAINDCEEERPHCHHIQCCRSCCRRYCLCDCMHTHTVVVIHVCRQDGCALCCDILRHQTCLPGIRNTHLCVSAVYCCESLFTLSGFLRHVTHGSGGSQHQSHVSVPWSRRIRGKHRLIFTRCVVSAIEHHTCWQILDHAFTSSGKELGLKVQNPGTYVATNRCGFLMACAIYHELDEVCVGCVALCVRYQSVAELCDVLVV